MTGAWSMTDEGEFVLAEPYASELAKVKRDAMNAWVRSVVTELASVTGYGERELACEFQRRCTRDDAPMEIVDAFVIEAMEGEL